LPAPARAGSGRHHADALAHAPALAEAQAEAQRRVPGWMPPARRQPLAGGGGEIGTGRIDNGGFFGFTAACDPAGPAGRGGMPLYAGGGWRRALIRPRRVDVAQLGWPMPPRIMVGAVAAYAEC
jgi:outer membrane protein